LKAKKGTPGREERYLVKNDRAMDGFQEELSRVVSHVPIAKSIDHSSQDQKENCLPLSV
jgi:hypothetical protein